MFVGVQRTFNQEEVQLVVKEVSAAPRAPPCRAAVEMVARIGVGRLRR